MAEERPKKNCFVVGPIGAEGSPQRTAADWLLHYVIKPVLDESFVVVRADTIATPGMITSQVITSVLDADLIVADLTDHNPNAFYELALAHMAERRVIQMITSGQRIPFDLQEFRTIHYSVATVGDVDKAKADLHKHAKDIATAAKVSNPVTVARGNQRLSASADTSAQILTELVKENRVLSRKLSEISARLSNVEQTTPLPSRFLIDELVHNSGPNTLTGGLLSPYLPSSAAEAIAEGIAAAHKKEGKK